MFFTARQLQEMHKTGGGVTLPYRARLTPLAADWAKSKGITVGYAEAPAKEKDPAAATVGRYLWWCDGPCGAAKAAVTSLEKELALSPLPLPADARQLASAVKYLAGEVKANRAAGGVLLVASGGAAVVYANRCPSLRAIMGTCLGSVDEGVNLVAANVLIIEHPWQTLMQARNMLSRFVRAKRQVSDETGRQLAELATCG